MPGITGKADLFPVIPAAINIPAGRNDYFVTGIN